MMRGVCEDGNRIDDVIARQANLIRTSLLFTTFFFSMSMAVSTVQNFNEPRSSFQYSFSFRGVFLFLVGSGIF